MSTKRIAIIGAGIAGSLAALDLADRGNEIVLFDAADEPLTGASFVNEGKIHLGFVYAADPTGRTAATMIEGAMAFRSMICRWVEGAVFDSAVAEPFDYAVPEDSQVPPERIEVHFSRVTELARAALAGGSGDYLGYREMPDFKRLGDHPYGSPDLSVLAAYQTPERAIDTHVLANAIRNAVLVHPAIEFRPRRRVIRCMRERNGWRVEAEPDGDHGFDAVLNASWHNRRLVNRASGVADPGDWFLRYKTAAILPDVQGDLANLTLMLGRYGDVVRYASGRVYLSWYPTMMLAGTREIDLPVPVLDERQRAELIRSSIRALARYYPQIERFMSDEAIGSATLIGGHITARGSSDIEDAESLLHRRNDIGPIAHGDGFFSLETGKYTTAPLFAGQIAEAISPAKSVFGRASR